MYLALADQAAGPREHIRAPIVLVVKYVRGLLVHTRKLKWRVGGRYAGDRMTLFRARHFC